MNPQSSFDYIVIGAGSAGCVVANRLTEDENVRVLLLEAGGPDASSQIHNPDGFVSLMGSEVDWKYQSEVQPNLAGRRIVCNRGKTLGGTSATNAMIYIRGHQLDFDNWNYQGCEGWSYREVLPYFRKMEDCDRGASKFRGAGGPVRATHSINFAPPSPAAEAFVNAGVERGFRGGRDWDFNIDAAEESVGYYDFSITKDGQRCSTAVAYLNPIRDRQNLTITTGALVSRLDLDGDRVVGVTYQKDGRTCQVRADREVIVSAGAFDSPKLLLLSGIGPADRLQSLGIRPLINLPGVGQNLQDHLLMPVVFKCRRPQPVPRLLAEAGMLHRTRGGMSSAAPDLQVNFNATIPALLPKDFPGQGPSFTFITILVRPQSTGYVALRSTNPADQAIIQPNYLQCEADMQVQLKAIELCRELVQTHAFADLLDAEALPGPGRTEEELRHYVQTHASTIWHPAGTCKMGYDQMAVVDPELRVHGVRGLRVIDASIMPSIVSANPNAAIIMIGEKGADLIKADAQGRGFVLSHVAPELALSGAPC